MAQTASQNHFGIRFNQQGQCEFSVWAKKARTLDLELKLGEQSVFHPMVKNAEGFFQITVSDVTHGDRYRFRIDQHTSRPDPAALYYAGDVHQWCKVIDHRRYRWAEDDLANGRWMGIEKKDLIIYELHVGTFTDQGTFLSTIERIPELVELGVTAIELLPIAQTPGRWNWGYDGVGLFSVENTYGTPDHLKQLVDACHTAGLAIILDVVYNHLGPEGNYLSEFGPYFTGKHHTPWGAAWNFDDSDSQYVRQWMKQNVLQWIVDYRFDGLRLDAVHFMFDTSDRPILTELAEVFDELRHSQRRTLHMIGETNVHNAALVKTSVKKNDQHGTGFDAVWSDCLMHCLLGIAQPGLDLCHRQHNGAVDAAIALDQGFLYESFPYQRHDRGERADLDSFVIGLQNHDTVGNHPQGWRLKQLASREFQFAAAVLYLLYPAIPMLFMGEAFACENPFLYFVEFGDPRLNQAVAKGRASEFPEMAKMEGVSPLDSQTFYRSKIGPKSNGDNEMWAWYQSLIKLRKRFRGSGLLDQANLEVVARAEFGLFQLVYRSGRQRLAVHVRLGQPGQDSPRIEVDQQLGKGCVKHDQVLLATNDLGDNSIGVNEVLVTWQNG